jgi:acylphosphatase
MIRAKHYLVRGRVQGVGFRWFVQRAAERLGIVGNVRNLPSGEVEVRAQADESILELFKRELRNGPPSAQVGEVIEQDLPVTDRYSSFQIG